MRLGPMIGLYRRVHNLSIRPLAKEIGISTATLSRLENGHAVDGATFAAVFRWLLDGEVHEDRKRRGAA